MLCCKNNCLVETAAGLISRYPWYGEFAPRAPTLQAGSKERPHSRSSCPYSPSYDYLANDYRSKLGH